MKKRKQIIVQPVAATLARYASRVVSEWHSFGANYVFLTDTSAVPFGYLFKEAWKTAYPNEDLPMFYRVNPAVLPTYSPRSSDKDRRLSDRLATNPEYLAKIDEFFKKRVTKNDTKIVVFDEFTPRGNSTRAVKDEIVRITNIDPKNVMTHNWDGINIEYRDSRGRERTIGPSLPTLTRKNVGALASKNRMGIRQAVKELRGRIRDPSDGVLIEKVYNPRTGYRDITDMTKINLTEYIHELKQIGREAGEEIKREGSKPKSLERYVGPALMGIVGLAGSILFLSPSITGNIIGINQSSSNWIGAVLFILGLIGAFAYFKSNK